MVFFFAAFPENLGDDETGPQPEVAKPDRAQCLECAFGKLLASGGVQQGEQAQVVEVITEAQSVSTSTLHTRATIYRCGALGCEHAMMTITDVALPILPDDPDEIHLQHLPGSTTCVIPEEDLE